MMMGCEIILPIHLIVRNSSDKGPILEVNYTCMLQERLAKSHEHARVQLKKVAVRQKRLYDLKACPAPYRRGDLVWLCSPFQQKDRTGPFLVVHKLCDALYRIQRSSRTQPKIVHFNRLKRYCGKALESWIPLDDPQVEIECEAPERSEVAANRPVVQILDSEEEVTEQILVQDLEENDDFSIADHNLNVSPMKTIV